MPFEEHKEGPEQKHYRKWFEQNKGGLTFIDHSVKLQWEPKEKTAPKPSK